MPMLSLLIEKGARVNHRDKEGSTVLHETILRRNLEMATYLLEHGAEYEVKDKHGRSPLSWTWEWYEGDFLPRQLYSNSSSSYSIAELLIKHGADIDSSDCDGNTALAYAASTGDKDLTSLLIKHGARVNSKDKYGRTPLSYAAACDYSVDAAVVALLIEHGAQIETRCIEMRTPLSYAAENWSISELGCLTENGAVVNSSDWKGNTPLMHAMNRLSYSVRMQNAIDFLLCKDANIITVNKDGDSPLLVLKKLLYKRLERSFTEEESEGAKEDLKRKLRQYRDGERKPPTFSDTISQVVAQLTWNLIEIVTSPAGIESTDHQIAVKSSAQLFCRWNLHPTVSSIRLQDNRTIEQEMTNFVLAQIGRYEQDIADAEKSTKKRLGPVSRPLGSSQPDGPPPLQLRELGMLNTEAWEKSGNYGGLAPSQGSKYCSYYLHRLAELQQRIFNVNKCLYYLDSNPDDCSKTIDELIAKVTGQQVCRFDHYSAGLDSKLGSDSSCEDDDVES